MYLARPESFHSRSVGQCVSRSVRLKICARSIVLRPYARCASVNCATPASLPTRSILLVTNNRSRNSASLITVPKRASFSALRGHVSTTLPPCATSTRKTCRSGSTPFFAVSSTTLLEPKPTIGSISPVAGIGRAGIFCCANTDGTASPATGSAESRARKSRRVVCCIMASIFCHECRQLFREANLRCRRVRRSDLISRVGRVPRNGPAGFESKIACQKTLGGPMHSLNAILIRSLAILLLMATVAVSSWSASAGAQAPAQARGTVFSGARLIVGDGRPAIENAAFIVDGGRFAWVGVLGDAKVPPGATRVDLTGKTVIPALIDTHVHLRADRAALIEDLERRAYYGVGAAMSLGQDVGDVPLQIRGETLPNAARFRSAGRGITAPEPGRTEIPYWITSEEQARKAVQELAAAKVDIVKIWVDDRDGKYKKLTPPIYGAVIDEAHRRGLRVTAHIFTLDDAKGLLRAGLDAFAHGVRDRDIDYELVALFRERKVVIVVPNFPDRVIAPDLE